MADAAPAIVLAGPTASGKTDLAIRLYQQGGYEIVSVDSAMVYRGLDIGSAKPDKRTLAEAPHHLIDICEPEDSYSAGAFVEDALAVMVEIKNRGNVPILTGGTFLYLRALSGGLHNLPSADNKIRAELDVRAEREGWPALHNELRRVDPQTAARIDANDRQRIQRALEVYALTGRSLSSHHASADRMAPLGDWEIVWLALMPASREWLHLRIAERFELMLEGGFVEEVKALMQRPGLTASHSSMRSVGYRQVWGMLDGEYDLATAHQKGLAATRQLAKRQMTWIRNDAKYLQLDPIDKGIFDRISNYVANMRR